MLALLASVLLVSYVVIPGVVFRTVFSFFVPLRAFDRTRTQEFSYSVVVCVLPFILAVILVWETPLGRHPFSFPDNPEQRANDYRTVILASLTQPLESSIDLFWDAAVRSLRRQARVLVWYVGLVGLEALILGFSAARWGVLQPKLADWPRLDQLFTRLLLGNVSEWHVLLTNFLFPGTVIHADVLTAEDRLYRGEVLNYTVSREGNLTGLYLNNAERYDRPGLLADREKAVQRPSSEYWKSIPGQRLFLFADKLFTLNIRPMTTLATAERLALALDPLARVTVVPIAAQDSPAQSPPEPGKTD